MTATGQEFFEGACAVVVEEVFTEVYRLDRKGLACVEHAVDTLAQVGSRHPFKRIAKVYLRETF